jgi:hypothetical protein
LQNVLASNVEARPRRPNDPRRGEGTVSIPTPYEICLEQREWYRRDPVTGNFVRDDPPVQFTVDDLLAALEAKATDKALIQQQLAEIADLKHDLDRYMKIANIECNEAEDAKATIERLSAALVELRKHCHSETRQGLLSIIDAVLGKDASDE